MSNQSLEYRVAFKAIHDVLINEWDPIGVNDVPEAQDEYDSYIPSIYRLLKDGATDAMTLRHLEWIRTDCMGLSPGWEANAAVVRRLREVVP